jgi:nitrogenase molybdenum-iron protein alpha/beta subunit
MKRPHDEFPKTYTLPYQLGVYLAVNAVPDVCLVVDGLNCALPKADLLAGNHDLNSTLFSPLGRHRLVATMTGPLPQHDNPEKKLSKILRAAADSGEYGAVLVTGLPYMNLAGMDYDGVAAGIKGRAPVSAVPALSLEEDWLDGYDRALEALVSALPRPKVRKKKRSVALAGYFYDRAEGDHRANLAEIGRLLGLAGLELACVIPGGDAFGSWKKALSAEVVVSLPYGRRTAARLAAISGARLAETGLPVGFAGTSDWLRAVRKAAGLGPLLPPPLAAAQRDAAAAVSRALGPLEHAGLLFAGDPYLYAAVSGFARELGLRPAAAFLNSRSRPLPPGTAAPLLMFSPGVGEASAALARLGAYDRPSLAVCDYFARAEGLAGAAAAVELGFPSYTRHCLHEEPFMGYAGAKALAGRLLNAALERQARNGAAGERL